jgi:hypothetical protein
LDGDDLKTIFGFGGTLFACWCSADLWGLLGRCFLEYV